MPMLSPRFTSALVLFAQLLAPARTSAQMPEPAERVTFEQAIDRAIRNNPSSAIAAAGILRAQGLLAETRAASRLQVNGSVVTTTLNRGVEFEGQTVTPRNQVTGTLDVRMPLYAPAQWARTTQAADTAQIAVLSADDVRRQTALATADTYLTVIARRREVEANVVARDTARAHFDVAHQMQERGAGSLLNELRAQQELTLDEGLVETARLALYRAQEALGVLIVADGPVDAADEPVFAMPTDVDPVLARTDLRLFSAEQQAAQRVWRDSSKDRFPSLDVVFQPSSTYPSQFFTPQNSWRLLMQTTVPLFDSGQRSGLTTERRAAVEQSQATYARALTTARSEVRAARQAVASGERGLEIARAGAEQARRVVDIVNVSFRAGAATNIEVIDAERRARDADLAAAVAEDTLRRARLELLTASGQFP